MNHQTSPTPSELPSLPEVEAAVAEAVEIADDTAFADLCRRCREAGLAVMDTEFERTDTYHPRIALLQFSLDGRVWIVDPLGIEDTGPLRELLEDPEVEKVLHSCSEDIEVLHHWTGARPVRLFDTQMAAAFLGGRYGMGYGELVRGELGVELAKGETRSDWLQRPLTESQHHYACLDVIYLAAVHARQRRQLELTGRLGWLLEECSGAVSGVLDRPGPEAMWRSVKGAGTLDARSVAALQELAAWRDRTARDLDRPRSRVARDEHLLLLARDLPEDVRALRGGGLPHGMVKRWAEPLQAAVDRARALAEADLPEPLPPPLSRREGDLLKRLRRAAAEVAVELGMAEELLARKRLVEQWLLGDEPVPEAYRGWRWPLVGERLEALRDRGTPERPGGAG
ncbi:MAG: ribonuclease D [Gammaproteobacteria bacterium]|nr:ribonuclease D [Gammaproteobacteria bacterium]